MDLHQLSVRLRGCMTTAGHFADVVRRMHNVRLLPSLEPDTQLTAEQCAAITYLSAATTDDNRDAAIYLISEDEPPAWCQETGESIVEWLAFLIQDTWRPFGMVDHITFFRNSGAAVSVNETDRAFMRRFDGCLPIKTTGQDSSDLTGLDITLLAAAYCGDVVHGPSPTSLTTIDNEQSN